MLPWQDQKFLQRFHQKYMESDDDKCWVWLYSVNTYGYGHINYNGKLLLAHRIAWSYAYQQEIPEGMDIRHSCDNPPCVNFNHLTPGTRQQNMDDKMERGRNYKPTHCPQGHEYSEQNTYVRWRPTKTGMKINRICRKCNLAAQYVYQAKIRERKKSGNH